jgi:hypothetical protein
MSPDYVSVPTIPLIWRIGLFFGTIQSEYLQIILLLNIKRLIDRRFGGYVTQIGSKYANELCQSPLNTFISAAHDVYMATDHCLQAVPR